MAKNVNERREALRKGKDETASYWLGEIEKAEKRESSYRKEAEEINAIYSGEKEVAFNILYSNTEVLGPAIYNALPIPDTRPKGKRPSDTATAAAGLVDAYLAYFIDSGDRETPSYDEVIQDCRLQALVPGRGVCRFHYTADIEYSENNEPVRVRSEKVFAEALEWDRVLFGYARSWKDVPWVAFIHDFTEDEAERNLTKAVAERLIYEKPAPEDRPEGAQEEQLPKTARVYEVWDKSSRTRFFLHRGYKNEAGHNVLINQEADPYQLEGFFPMQEPLTFVPRVKGGPPTPLYRLYRKQAQELNHISERIMRLVEGMKVRGIYDNNLEGLDKLLKAGDNDMIGVQNLRNMADSAKADSALWLVPIEKHVTVLQQLFLERQETKTIIFEIMGIADIMRGSSAASETLGAQRLKNQWGSLRLKRFQKRMAIFIRDGLRIAAELAFTKLDNETLRNITNSRLPTAAQLAPLEAAAQARQPLDPEQQALLALPSFDDALTILREDLLRCYSIDIETNSTVEDETTEDKRDLQETLAAMGQFLNGMSPLVEKGILPFDAAKGILLGISKRSRFGREVEEFIRQMKQPAPPEGASPAAQKAMQDLQKKQGELAKKEEGLKEQETKLQLDRIKFEADQRVAAAEQRANEAVAAEKERARTAVLSAKGTEAKARKQVEEVNQQATAEQMLSKIQLAAEKLAMQAKLPREGAEGEEEPEKSIGEEIAEGLAPVMQALQQGLATLGQQLGEAIIQSAALEREAVKDPRTGVYRSRVIRQ